MWICLFKNNIIEYQWYMCTLDGVGSESVSISPGLKESPSNTRETRLVSGVFDEAGLMVTVMAVQITKGKT